MIGLALACTMAIVGDSAKASIDKSVSENFVGDFIVSNVIGQGFSPTIADQMAQVDGVDQVVRERFASAERGRGSQFVAAVDPADIDLLDLDVGDGGVLGAGSVMLQRTWADDEGLKVGSDLSLDTPAGERTYTVAGIFEDNPVVAAPVLTSLDDFSAAGFPDSDNVLILFTDDSPGIQDRLDQVVADLPVVTVKDQAAFAEEQRAPIDQFVLMIFALLGSRPGDRRARHRQHVGALGDRADPRGGAAARDRGEQSPATADDHARVGGDRRARCGRWACCSASASG